MNAPAPHNEPRSIGELAAQVVTECNAARERRWRLTEMVAALKRLANLTEDIVADLDDIECDLLADAEIDAADEVGIRTLYLTYFGEWRP